MNEIESDSVDVNGVSSSDHAKYWAINTVTPFLQNDLAKSTSHISDGEAISRFERIVTDLVNVYKGV